MKKILMIMSLVLAMAMTSCSESPSDATKKLFKAANGQEYTEMVKYIGDKDGNALTKDQQDGLADTFKQKASKDKEFKDGTFNVESETISEDGKSAIVKYSYETPDGKTKEDSMKLVKGEDGKWRMPLTK